MFEKLPYHIVVQILRNLPPVDLKNVMTLNSEFFEIISTSSSLNRTLKLSLTEHKLGESQEVAQAILNGNRTYESIDINSGGIPKCRKLYSEFVADFMKMKGKHVKVFSHSGKTTVEYFLFLLNFMPNIETLNAINPLNPLIMGSMLSNFSLIGLKFLNLKLEDSNRSDFLEFCQKFISLQRNLKVR